MSGRQGRPSGLLLAWMMWIGLSVFVVIFGGVPFSLLVRVALRRLVARQLRSRNSSSACQ